MKVELVGTGAIYTKYNSACTLINEELIVDMPNGTLKQLLKNNHKPEKIKALLITHMHGDHISDIPFLLKHVYNYIKIDNEITIIGPKGIEDKVVELFATYRFEDREEIREFMNIEFIELNEEEKQIEVENYKVNAIQVSHGAEKPAYGYTINNTISCTGDSGICENIEKLIKNSKVTIADTSLREGDHCHMGIDNIKYLAEKYNKQIIATHLRDTTREELSKQEYKNILVVEDGYKFEI